MVEIPSHARGYEGFAGEIGPTIDTSTPAWPDEPTAPTGAPNIVVVLVDDLGYSDIGPFGSEIDTPNLDRLARNGLRLSNYHTAPLCSPARAALLTGLNPHRAGYGWVANADPGFPGLRLELADDVLTLPEILRSNGYATYAVGKWHLVRDRNLSPGRPRDSYPTQRGFDRYYGSLEGLNSFFHPNQLTVDNSPLHVDEYPADYYITDDLTNKAESWIKDLRAHEADKPFFLYFAHVAMHGPLQAKDVDLHKYRGKYAAGWDAIREARFAKQSAEGIFAPDVVPAPRNSEPGFDVPEWDSLEPHQQERFARYMEVYAAVVDSVDQSVGRLVKLLEDLDELDNTIIVFTSDNGGTAEGGPQGTRSYFAEFSGLGSEPGWQGDYPHPIDDIGTERLGVHYPRGWGQVSNTPFRFYKGQTFAGGVRVPFIVSWPKALPANQIRHEYSYVTDLVPTLLDLAGLESPTERNGKRAKSVDGVSVAEVYRSGAVTSPHVEQYAEMGGHRGFYRDGWKLLSLHTADSSLTDPQWSLYYVRIDPAETLNLAADLPEKVAELAQAWEEAAWANTVFPQFAGEPGPTRRPSEARLSEAVRILPGSPVLERYRSAQLIQYRDFAIEAAFDGGYRDGDDGVLVAHGDPHGGYVLYIEDGKLQFDYNQYGVVHTVHGGAIRPGTAHVGVRATVQPGIRWSFRLLVDGAQVGVLDAVAQLVGLAPWTGISIGRDARGSASWPLRHRRGQFRYSGAIHSVTYQPGPFGVSDELIALIESEADHVGD